MSWKDLFSAGASGYSQFRPTYPAPLFSWLGGVVPGHRLAVDVGAGSGQAARDLVRLFQRVVAVDPSRAQLASGGPHPGVDAVVGSASALPVGQGTADLIASAQAFHWFNHPAFFAEVARVARPDAVLALWCYGLSAVSPEVDAAVFELYDGHLGPFWEPERRLIETGYAGVAIPFVPIEPPSFEMKSDWTFAQFGGYLSTWSPLDKYRQATGRDALEAMAPKLAAAWGNVERPRTVVWPLSLRVFRVWSAARTP